MKKIIKLILIGSLVIYARDTIINEMDKYKNIIATEINKSIILNVKANPTELWNGCVPASTQTIIKYVTGKEIPQKTLAQEENYNSKYGTYLINTKDVLNNYLSSFLKGKKYLHRYFHPEFGKKIQEQKLFYEMIHYSLKNNFPIHFGINGYLNQYYNNKFIKHAVVLNGVEKANTIENYTYHISDNNNPLSDMTFKSKDLHKLFNASGEMNYYS